MKALVAVRNAKRRPPPRCMEWTLPVPLGPALPQSYVLANKRDQVDLFSDAVEHGSRDEFLLHIPLLPLLLPHFAAWGPARPSISSIAPQGAGDGCDSRSRIRSRLAQA